MNKLIFICILGIFGFTQAQTPYEKGMDKAFALWKSNKMDEAVNLFERIANAEKDNWLPHYYIAQINSIKSWSIKDETVLKKQLNKAQNHLNLAKALSDNNPELLIMQGQVYTNWIAFDGRTYGMKYAVKVTELYNKAEALEPNNPRAVMCKASFAMNSARYFGQDPTEYCDALEKSLSLFDSYKAKGKYHPTWGKAQAVETMKPCKS